MVGHSDLKADLMFNVVVCGGSVAATGCNCIPDSLPKYGQTFSFAVLFEMSKDCN